MFNFIMKTLRTQWAMADKWGYDPTRTDHSLIYSHSSDQKNGGSCDHNDVWKDFGQLYLRFNGKCFYTQLSLLPFILNNYLDLKQNYGEILLIQFP